MSGPIASSKPPALTAPAHPPPPARADAASTQVASELSGLRHAYQTAIDKGRSAAALQTMGKDITLAAEQLGLSDKLPKADAVKVDVQV